MLICDVKVVKMKLIKIIIIRHWPRHVIRNDQGMIYGALAKALEGSFSPLLAECFALCEGLKFAQELELCSGKSCAAGRHSFKLCLILYNVLSTVSYSEKC